MWKVHGGWILILALLKILLFRKVKQILMLELNQMPRAVTQSRTRWNNWPLKPILIKNNMIING
jgi:hypothetical protein